MGLLIGLAVLFNLHWLNVGNPGAPGMQWFIYPLTLGAVLSILLFPVFSRISSIYSLIFWLVVYALLKMVAFAGRPLFGEIYTYLTLAEVTLLGLIVMLANGAAAALRAYMRAVEFVTLVQGGSKIPPLEASLELIEAEINRSRHNNRAFSVLLASLDPKDVQIVLPRLVTEAQERIMRPYATIRLAQILRSELRRMDMVLEDHKNGRVVIVSPEVDELGAETLLGRLSASVADKLGVPMQCGAASFPNRALTFDDLVRAAEQGTSQEAYYRFSDSTGVAD
jgi:hypothetical protein